MRANTMNRTEFFIKAANLVSFDGVESVPSVLYFQSNDLVQYGIRALEGARSRQEVNENFKLALGRVTAGRKLFDRELFGTAHAGRKSAIELTQNFVSLLMRDAQAWISLHGHYAATRVLVSEPLSFHEEAGTGEWLSNYRDNLRRIFSHYFEHVDFLPEPFAVFQYYRYGLKHPLVTEKKKYVVLVLDFGGGTFDISVIETNRDGELSSAGRHSRPLAASSVPIGGFIVNQKLAESVLFGLLFDKADKELARKAVANYERWKRGEQDISVLNARNQAFVRCLDRLTYDIELPKIALSGLIADWRLDVPIGCGVPVEVPSDPFDQESPLTRVRLGGEEFRGVFETQVWNVGLKHSVRQALDRGRAAIGDRDINLVLLSGGSANIRWLRELLLRDFSRDLNVARVVSLTEDFQLVVAKGLAVECARRSHEAGSEFRSVTYNPVYAVLDADGTGQQIRPFKPMHDVSGGRSLVPGQLLPSASALRKFVGGTLRWKVRLPHPPKQRLDYFFLRSTLDVEDVANLYNVDHSVFTESGTNFDSNIRVELDIRADGTCVPRFVYRVGQDGQPQAFREGRPFCIDMTLDEGGGARAYLGVDFGTSNTSISYVDQEAIDIVERRGREGGWLELGDLVERLPFPVANPLQRLLGETGTDGAARAMLEVVEACLAFAAYTAYAEAVSSGRGGGGLFREFVRAQRSVGPLKKLLFGALEKLAGRSIFAQEYRTLADRYSLLLEKQIAILNDFKHNKVSAAEVDAQELIRVLANACNRAMDGCVFGHFEGVTKMRFGNAFSGVFRVASVARPFYRMVKYEGREAFSPEEAFIVNLEEGRCLALSPLILWRYRERQAAGEEMCEGIDKYEEGKGYSYVVFGEQKSRYLSPEEDQELVTQLEEMRKSDCELGSYEGLKFTQREDW